MCSAPDFAPGEFRYVDDVGIYNNPTIFYQYEPGSILNRLPWPPVWKRGR